MISIWKFPLAITGEQMIQMPFKPQVLDLQMQNGQPCLWALVDTNQPKYEHKILDVRDRP